jgi:predicted nucleotide-binding protein (sugar kinase/HSP70/actin superfamily)
MHLDPTIDTIFEIGGQDSKYMRTAEGGLADAVMNYVCAAGTGAFVEEQARKLGFRVEDVGRIVMGIAPPKTTDRCTVFMEEDVNTLLSRGHSRREAMAAVLYSVAQNYLNKVVGGRYRSSERILFQGATARNPGLVAAFENLLDVEIVVSPYAHVMGAWGAALRAREAIRRSGRTTRFRGLDLASRSVHLSTDRCDRCSNACEITSARIAGEAEEPAWGHRCGREKGEARRVSRELRLFRARDSLLARTGRVELAEGAPAVAISRALTFHDTLPLWRRFFGELGYRVELSPKTDDEIGALGSEISGADFCHPVKVALGHARWAVERSGSTLAFFPHMISGAPNPHTSNSHYCPLVQAFPSLVRAALDQHGVRGAPVLAPVIDMRWKDDKQVRELADALGPALGRSTPAIRRAWRAARESLRQYRSACLDAGARVLAEIEDEDRPAVLVAGRSYVSHDPGINLGIVRRIAEKGHTVIPLDCVPSDSSMLGEESGNLYWRYPQQIIAALRGLRSNPRVYPLYLTCFNCGPDSFIVSSAEAALGGKPMLVLSLDDHDADAGYVTRIEAFLDTISTSTSSGIDRAPQCAGTPSVDDFRGRTLWFPQMHYPGAALVAAAFRSFGYDAQMLPLETQEDFTTGRSLTSGGECLPAASTIGVFVNTLREIGAEPSEHALFMPSASGPCRFGQYAARHRKILDELGWREAAILSPSSVNSYQGLPEALRRTFFRMMVIADIMLKLRCKVAAYEREPGETEAVFRECVARVDAAVAANQDYHGEWLRSLEVLAAVPKQGAAKPLVGIVGEIYVRCNAFCNQDVIGAIERAGGEAWLAPIAEWVLYTAFLQKWRAREELRGLVFRGRSLIKNRYLRRVERELYRRAASWVGDREEPEIGEVVEAGRRHLPLNFEGEAILTVGRAVKFIEDGASLVVNCAPFGCMPGAVSSALFQGIEEQTGVPIVNLFYDGAGDLNDLLEVYLGQELQ